jgi:hypothetical protein
LYHSPHLISTTSQHPIASHNHVSTFHLSPINRPSIRIQFSSPISLATLLFHYLSQPSSPQTILGSPVLITPKF